MDTNRFYEQSPSLAGTDANDTNYILNPSDFTARVAKVQLVPAASVATHGSNYITVNIKKGSTTIATMNTESAGTAMTAGTVITLSITGSGKDLEIASGGVLTVEVAKSGTGPTYEFYAKVVFEAIH